MTKASKRDLYTFPELEDQMTSFTSTFDRASAGFSPSRVDALAAWAVTDLVLQPMKGFGIYEYYRQRALALQQSTGS